MVSVWRRYAVKALFFASILTYILPAMAEEDIDTLYDQAKANKKVVVHSLTEAKKSAIKVIKNTYGSGVKQIEIFCNDDPLNKDLKNMWTSVTMKLLIPTEDFQLFEGTNESVVYSQHIKTSQSWINLMPWKTESISLPPFNKTCIGVRSTSDYSVRFHMKVIDLWLIVYLLSGLLLFFSARKLSKNIMFYYGTGISLGVLASVLILFVVVSRFVPKKSGYLLVIGGWSMTLYLLQFMWKHVQLILESYYHFVVGYFLVAVLGSFAVCYVKGPVTNPKLINIIMWSIQLVGLLLVFNGTQIAEVSVTIIILMIVHQNFPSFIRQGLKSFWRKRFPPKIKLLSEEEYIRQGTEETRKALEELRVYCRSPNCDAWKTISRLNTPNRFANWVEGSQHLSDDEILAYDEGPIGTPSFLTDDEEEIDFTLNSL